MVRPEVSDVLMRKSRVAEESTNLLQLLAAPLFLATRPWPAPPFHKFHTVPTQDSNSVSEISMKGQLQPQRQ